MTQVLDRPAHPTAPTTAHAPKEAAHGQAPVGPPARPAQPQEPPARPSYTRPALAIAFAMLAVAVMIGGEFSGWTPRVFAGVGGVAGVLLAVYTATTSRVWLAQFLSTLAIGVLALAAAATSGLDSVSQLGGVLGRASTEGRTLPTPLAFSPDWRFLVVIVSAAAAYGAAWLATDLHRPRLALLLPLPLLVFAAIGQPQSVQTVDGIAAFALYALALAILYRDTGPESGLRLSREFEIKRTIRAAIVVGLVVAALVGLDRADFLFPSPTYDPSKAAQLPQSAPANEQADRVLFTVKAPLSANWRTGVLNNYDGTSWRLPPASSSNLVTAGPGDELEPKTIGSITADFNIADIDGPTLPTPQRAGKLNASSGSLEYDKTSGALRLSAGQLPKGLTYSVAYAPLPTENELKDAIPADDRYDTEAPAPPTVVKQMLTAAPAAGWQRADWARLQLLNRVVVNGTGEPSAIPPEKVADMLQSKDNNYKATPFELVAAEALMERWAGIPARVGYGYEGGDKHGNAFEVHPKHAATWLEVNFRNLGWFPVTGGPLRATPTLGDKGNSSSSQPAIPGPDIAVNLFVPLDEVSPVPDYQVIRVFALLALGAAILAALVYFLWPLPYKAYKRARRRLWARRMGPAAQIAVAYAEFRELAIDFGDSHAGETPLYFLDRVSPDLEHTELAWLVTRTLWGDLPARSNEVIAAEMMSRSLRRRLARGQPGAIRVIAALSRASLRNPYWINLEELAALRRTEMRTAAREAA